MQNSASVSRIPVCYSIGVPGANMRTLVVVTTVAALAMSTMAAPATRSVYAIKDAKIYPVSGAVIESGTLLIRNGLIEAVGAGVQIPAEATVIDGAGLAVYPGLIDSFSDAGLPAGPAPGVGAPAGQPQQPQQPPPQQQQQPAPKNTHEAIFQPPNGLHADRVLADQVRPRSEERRVGKEGGTERS